MNFNSSDLTFDKRETEREKKKKNERYNRNEVYNIYCFPARANLFIHRHMFLFMFEHYGYIYIAILLLGGCCYMIKRLYEREGIKRVNDTRVHFYLLR